MTINSKGILFFIESKVAKGSAVDRTLKAKQFLYENNIPFIIKYVEDLSLEEIKYIVKLAQLEILDESDLGVDERLLNLKYRLNVRKQEDLVKRGIFIEDLRLKDIPKTIFIAKELLKLPLAIKDDILVVGYTRDCEYQQFLCGENRYDIKWLGGNELLSDEERANWIVKQFKPPKRAYIDSVNCKNSTKIYMPKESILYGGNIYWVYPTEYIDCDGFVVKPTRNIGIKMTVELGNIKREIDSNLSIVVK